MKFLSKVNHVTFSRLNLGNICTCDKIQVCVFVLPSIVIQEGEITVFTKRLYYVSSRAAIMPDGTLLELFPPSLSIRRQPYTLYSYYPYILPHQGYIRMRNICPFVQSCESFDNSLITGWDKEYIASLRVSDYQH